MMSDRLENKKVTLEEVLRLKRSERPDPSFWAQFEEQLRAKQLAAIVERRPWWHLDLARVSSGVARLRVPLGATAVLALTIVTVQQYRSPATAGASLIADTEVVPSSEVAQINQLDAVISAPGTSDSMEIPVNTPVGETTLVASTDTPTPSSRVTTRRLGGVSPMLPWLGEMESVTGDAGSQAGSSLVAEFSGLRAHDLVLESSMTEADRAFTSLRPQDRSANLVEPLTQVTAPSESRRERLAALVAPAALKSNSSKSSDRVRERMISRLSEDELYINASRLGVDKGRLSLSF